MPRGRSGAAVMDRPSPTTNTDPLGARAADLRFNLSYESILADEGVFRDPSVKSTGFARWVNVASENNVSRRGKAFVQQKKIAVAMSAEDARAYTKATGDRHDWYDPGSECPKCSEPLVGWVLGGRKRAVDHDHVTLAPPSLYRTVEVEVDDDEMTEDESPAVVGEV